MMRLLVIILFVAIGAGLRIVVAPGGKVAAKTADAEGHPVRQGYVWFLPAAVATPADLESELTQYTIYEGACQSRGLAPGKYFVIATREQIEHTADQMDRLWAARLKAKEVEVTAGKRVETTLAITSIF